MRICATVLAALVPLVTVPSQGAADVTRVEDAEVTDDRLAASDAVAFEVWRAASSIEFRATMSRPIAEGMFTCVHVFLNCDDNTETGLNGAEVWVRGAVGSRFRPNAWVPKIKSLRKPLANLRASFSYANHQEVAGRKSGIWTHRGTLRSPRVSGKTISFGVPLRVLARYGSRYESGMGIRARIDTTCAEQPLSLDHRCRDEGMEITVDGSDEEWTGANELKDPPDELHAAAAFLDLLRLRVDHDATNLFVLLDMQKPGVTSTDPEDSDILRRDSISVHVQPLLTRYQKPLLVRVPTGTSLKESAGWNACLTEKTAEFSFTRKAAQARFRVLAWTDVERHDRIPDSGWIAFDPRKK